MIYHVLYFIGFYASRLRCGPQIICRDILFLCFIDGPKLENNNREVTLGEASLP